MAGRRERGANDDGVRINRVRAASIGPSIIDESVEENAVMAMLARGAEEARMAVLGRVFASDGRRTSASGMPNTAATKAPRNASSVRCRMV